MTTKKNTAVQQVQDEFIEKLEKDGLVTMLQWIGDWYDRAARASVQDELDRALGAQVRNQEARELYIMDLLSPEAKSASNFSTSAGHNLYRLSRIAALSAELEKSSAMFGSVGRRNRDNVVWANIQAKDKLPK